MEEEIRGRQRTLLCEQCFSLSGYCPYLIFKYITLQNIFLAFGDYFLIPPSSIIHEIPPSSIIHEFLSSRQLRILVEVGLSLFEEGATSLLSLIEEIVEHCGVASQLLDSRLTVELGIQSRLDHAKSQR